MTIHFVDANIFLRHLTNDDPAKAPACLALFERAATNQVALTTSEAVIAEVVYILASKKLYGLAQEDIKLRLYPLLSLRGFKLPQKAIYLHALDYYAVYKFDFEDCLTVAHMEHQRVTKLYSYDQDFDQVNVLERLEP